MSAERERPLLPSTKTAEKKRRKKKDSSFFSATIRDPTDDREGSSSDFALSYTSVSTTHNKCHRDRLRKKKKKKLNLTLTRLLALLISTSFLKCRFFAQLFFKEKKKKKQYNLQEERQNVYCLFYPKVLTYLLPFSLPQSYFLRRLTKLSRLARF